MKMLHHEGIRFHRSWISKISNPEYDTDKGYKIVTMSLSLSGPGGEKMGTLGSLALIFVILMLIRFHVGTIVNHIKLLSSKARKVAKGDYGTPIPVDSEDEIGQLIISYNEMVKGLEERDFIRNSFGRYVDPEFARALLEHPEAGRLGGERREVAMMMSDIRGFTALSGSAEAVYAHVKGRTLVKKSFYAALKGVEHPQKVHLI